MTIEIVEKECTCCKEIKPIEAFRFCGKVRTRKTGRARDAQCKVCLSKKAMQRWHTTKTPDRSRKQHLWQRYKIRPEEYDALYKKQRGVCSICKGISKDKKRLRVDHCHSTGLIRGLLCSTCNTGLGGLGDSVKMLQNAIAYLRDFEQQPPVQPSKVRKPYINGANHHWYGKGMKGENNPSVVLTENEVRNILDKWDTQEFTLRQLGDEYGVKQNTIHRIVQRQTWKHIERVRES